MTKHRLLWVLFWPLLLSLPAGARASEYGLIFNRDNRTYRWNNFLRYQSSAGRRMQVRATGNLAKTLIKSASGSSGADRWHDNLDLATGFDYRLMPWAAIGVDLGGEQNEVNKGEITTRTGTFSSAIILDPLPDIQLSGSLGAKSDHKEQSNLNSREDGLSYGVSGSWQPSLARTQTTLKLALSGDRLTAGHSSSRHLSASVKRQLYRGARITLSLDDREEGRTDLFGPADATVLKKQDRINRGLSCQADLPLPRDHDLHMTLSSTDRRIEYSLPEGANAQVAEQNSRKTLHTLSAQVVGRPTERLTFSGDFSLQQGKNDFGRDINDEDLKEITLSATLGAALSRRDSVNFAGHVARTSYDAPDPENYNDRDSFRSALNLTYHHTFSEALTVVGEATVNLSHLVYLRSQRSANNNWARLYSLHPALHIRPLEGLTIDQRFGISANYTEYDFEDLFTDIKSNIFRQAQSTTNLTCRAGTELSLSLSYTFRVEDFGRLIRDDSWVEVLSWDKSFQNIDLSISYPLVSRLIITPNMGYGQRREYDHLDGERHFKSQMTSKRVGLSGRYLLLADDEMSFSMSRSVENATGIPERSFDRLQLSLQHTF